MNDEFPWLSGSSDENSRDTPTADLESLGFTFTEKSSALSPVADVATAALVPIDSSRSTDLVPLSRRAQREAERARTSSPRSRAGARRPERSAKRSQPALVAAQPPVAALTAPEPQKAVAPRPPLRRRIAKRAFPPIVMLAAAALLVGTSVPATALFDPSAPPSSNAMAAMTLTDASNASPPAEGQVLDVEAGENYAATTASRDEWSVTSYAEMLRLKYGNRNFSYSTSGTGAVRWPFPYAVPISSGFGERAAPCRSCSSYHQGLDFNPGAGTPIYAIADGIVIKAEHSGGFGNHAIIAHVINGQRVTSTYAHMTRDSSPLVVGQEIQVGDFVGTVGSTGVSTGAHLHFEIRIDDIAIDPFAWLQANAS
ncbi:MAG: peptidoglycan DD-metalloendopeptidase family protein [Microcella sp.]|uniref:M23 family metallopeptidase n=1 Tax=Microcella sp. TaxID=1913979 RepID=UPI0024CBA38B|nr:peptidoglycan DD-metalloendopeptidase family protein [Microcella sp.]UYN82788.1 MAG: peptidoglycan DD-metalloendopeptidase family protein [Microcella sp.]